jgi:DNA-binding NtrC family response regulator
MRILCVDDDPVARAIYARGLGEALPQDEIFQASSGEEAIHLLHHGHYDLVITDLQMPGQTGLDVLKAAREIDATTELIVVTGKASIRSAVEAMRYGARDFIEKPIDIPLLCEKVENTREYHARARDAEELREAKDLYEQQASKEVRLLELRISGLESRLQDALCVLRDAEQGAPEERVRRAVSILESAA